MKKTIFLVFLLFLTLGLSSCTLFDVISDTVEDQFVIDPEKEAGESSDEINIENMTFVKPEGFTKLTSSQEKNLKQDSYLENVDSLKAYSDQDEKNMICAYTQADSEYDAEDLSSEEFVEKLSFTSDMTTMVDVDSCPAARGSTLNNDLNTYAISWLKGNKVYSIRVFSSLDDYSGKDVLDVIIKSIKIK